MTTKQNQKEKSEQSDDSPRIPKDLERELKNKKLESESDFLFVEELQDLNDDVVKVKFETPFAGKVLSQKFSKPGSDTDKYEPLSKLYTSVGAEITNPKSILSISIPTDSEVINLTEEDSSGSNWIDDSISLYEKEERSKLETIGSGFFALAGFASSVLIFSGTILSSITALLILVTGLFLSYMVGGRNLLPPEESSPVRTPMDVSEGDTLVLDKPIPTSQNDREVCRVIEQVDEGIEVMLRDGNTVAVNYDSSESEWVIHDYSSGAPEINKGYASAYVISNNKT